MGRAVDRIVAERRENPGAIKFVDALKVSEHYFGPARKTGGSHHVFKTPWPGNPRVNLQEGASGKAKAYQVRQFVRAIDKLETLVRGQLSGDDDD